MTWGAIGVILGITGIISFVVAVIVALANRGIRQERIDHLTGRVQDLEKDLNHERVECRREIDALRTVQDRQAGQIDVLTGDLGERIGQAVAAAVVSRLVSDDRST